MKKLYKITTAAALSAALATSAAAVQIGTLEVSPEIGVSYTSTLKTKISNANDSFSSYTYKPEAYGAYARIWLGAFNWVVAPQAKFDAYLSEKDINSFNNSQYGLSLGRNFGLVVLRLTPYVGANYSSFNARFKNTISYNAGIKLKPAFIPLALSVQYNYQKPEFKDGGAKLEMQNIQVLLGLHF